MPSLVDLACFLPGRAKDLSAPPRRNMGASTSWNIQGLSGHEQGLLYHYLYLYSVLIHPHMFYVCVVEQKVCV